MIQNTNTGKGTAHEKGIDRDFTRGPPDSPEKKTREKGRGERVMCACMRCAYSNGEPGTGLAS
jgi:hypothetical protein